MATEQLALPIPKQPAKRQAAPALFGVVVDEVKLSSLGTPAASWWFTYAARFAQTGRERILFITLPGALAEYGPFDRETADFMQAHMIEHGVHPGTLKIRPWIADLPDCTLAGRCTRCGRTHRAAPTT